VAAAALTVLVQIAYPLTPDDQLGRLSVLTVLLFCGAGLAHARAVHGVAWTVRLFLVVVVGAFAAEALGVATGFPFGDYSYARSLGPLVAGVPLLVPLAWLMMAYPCLVMARLMVAKHVAVGANWSRTVWTAAIAGGAMASWDVFLDPQMVQAGHWIWRHPAPGLPGTDGVPLTNLGGWLLAAVLLMLVLQVALPVHDGPTDRFALVTPAVLLGWTWVGGVIGNAVFFDRPWVALWGGVLLGVFVAPYLGIVRERWRR